MRILYQGFQIQKELDYIFYIWTYRLVLSMKYQWFQVSVYFIYIKGYVKYLAAQKVNHLQIYQLLLLLVFCSCHQLNHPKYLKNVIAHLVIFSIYRHCSYWQNSLKWWDKKVTKPFIVLINSIRVGHCSEDNMKKIQLRKNRPLKIPSRYHCNIFWK